MKVVFFTTGMTKGGAERVIATISNRLVEMGHDVVIVILKGTESEYALDGRVQLVSANMSAGVAKAPAAMGFYRRVVREEAPDVVVSFTHKANLMACAAKRFFGVDVPLIISERANPFMRKTSYLVMGNSLFKAADLIVCQSKVISCYYEGRVSATPSVVIPNPVDEECVAAAPALKRGPYLLSAGRLCDQKRQDIAIRALAVLLPAHPDLRLKICGEGDGLPGCKALVEELGIAASVEFCGNVDNVMRACSDAAVYLMTSEFEGFPNALIEAVASGIPVVSTDFSPGVARELVRDGANGYVVSTGDAEAVAWATEKVLREPPSIDVLEDSARLMRERFSLERVAEQWVDACRFAMDGGAE